MCVCGIARAAAGATHARPTWTLAWTLDSLHQPPLLPGLTPPRWHHGSMSELHGGPMGGPGGGRASGGAEAAGAGPGEGGSSHMATASRTEAMQDSSTKFSTQITRSVREGYREGAGSRLREAHSCVATREVHAHL